MGNKGKLKLKDTIRTSTIFNSMNLSLFQSIFTNVGADSISALFDIRAEIDFASTPVCGQNYCIYRYQVNHLQNLHLISIIIFLFFMAGFQE